MSNGCGRVTQDPVVIDDFAAIVTEADFISTDPDTYRRLMENEKLDELSAWLEWDSLKASHAWTISGSKSLTGSPLLESDLKLRSRFLLSGMKYILAAATTT